MVFDGRKAYRKGPLMKTYVSFFKFIFFFLPISLIFLLTGCGKKSEPLSRTGFYFDTFIMVTLYDHQDEALLDECFSLAGTYENMLSKTKENSDVWNINHSNGTPATVSQDTLALLRASLFYAGLSNGKTDPTVGPVTELWDFSGSSPASLPDQADLEKALSHVGYEGIIIEGNEVSLADPDAGIDLGFIAKGYIADRIKDYLVSQGVTSATINLVKSDIELALVGENASATITPKTITMLAKDAEEGATPVEITDTAVQVAPGEYVITVVATVADSVSGGSVDFTTTCKLLVTVAGSLQNVSIGSDQVKTLEAKIATSVVLFDTANAKVTVNGASGKEISVDASNASIDGKTFTHRIKFGGTGSATSRYIGIEVKAAAKIIVYAASGSGGTARDLKLTKDDGTAVGSVSVDPITKCEYTVTGAGAFSLFSGGSGINVYGIEIIYNA